MLEQRELKRYLGEVRRSLVCPQRQKRAFMRTLQGSAEEYLASEPAADRAALEREFGTPGAIAESFLANDPASAVKKLRLKHWVLAALAVAVLAYLVFIVVSLIDVHEEAHGYFEEGILCAEPVNEGGESV